MIFLLFIIGAYIGFLAYQLYKTRQQRLMYQKASEQLDRIEDYRKKGILTTNDAMVVTVMLMSVERVYAVELILDDMLAIHKAKKSKAKKPVAKKAKK